MTKFKKIGRNVLWSLLVVTTTTACLDISERKEEFIAEYPAVKTQFAITVPKAEKSSRQPIKDVQQGNNYLGMDIAWLVPFRNSWSTGSLPDIYRNRLIPLPPSEGHTNETANVNVYKDVVVPVGTRYFLFYAFAKQQLIGTNTGLFQQGILKSTLQQHMLNVSDIHFDLEHCFNTSFGDSLWLDQAAILQNALNVVYKALQPWERSPIEARRNLYANFKRLEAGSAYMIRETLRELYAQLQSEEVKGTVANDESLAAVEYSIFQAPEALFEDKSFNWKPEHVQSHLYEFPILFNLPIGAVQIQYDHEHDKIVYMNTGNSPVPYAVDIMDICYPPKLTYFAATDIAVKDEKLSSWSNIWTDHPTFTGWGDEVALSTKTLALKNKVQYAEACLEARFKCEGNNLVHNGLPPVEVPEGGFPVTGILIGGQPYQVGWNFEPISSDPNVFSRIVFDRMHNVKKEQEGYVSGITADHIGWSAPNYTLLLKSKKQEKVSLLVEFKNTSNQVIYGIDNGLIPIGAPFYLMAVLEPDTRIEIQEENGSVWMDDPSIFIPDVTTVVDFSINSLEHAYLTIPDLRTTQMEVGMYVDLKWKTSRIVQDKIGK